MCALTSHASFRQTECACDYYYKGDNYMKSALLRMHNYVIVSLLKPGIDQTQSCMLHLSAWNALFQIFAFLMQFICIFPNPLQAWRCVLWAVIQTLTCVLMTCVLPHLFGWLGVEYQVSGSDLFGWLVHLLTWYSSTYLILNTQSTKKFISWQNPCHQNTRQSLVHCSQGEPKQH